MVDGSKDPTQAATVTAYLDYPGVGALVPPVRGGRAPRTNCPNTVVTFYNGAELRLPETMRVLKKTFGVAVATATDPTVKADVIVVTGVKTPVIQVPAR